MPLIIPPSHTQIGDVKVYIISGKDDVLAKTQVRNGKARWWAACWIHGWSHYSA